MASGLVVHVELEESKHTEVLTQERIRIGSCQNCELRLQPPFLLTPDSLLLELSRTNGHYRVSEFNPNFLITHNGAPVAHGTSIEDGDQLRVESSGLAIQFYPVGDLPAVVLPVGRQSVQVAPFIEQAAIEAAATARRDDAKVFLREFTRELVREINFSTKIATLLIAVALVGGMLYIGYAAYNELRRSRDLINRQNEQMDRLKQALDQTNNEFAHVRQTNNDIIDSFSLTPRLYSEYGNGVCIITGSYTLVEEGTGRPLRYPEFQTTEEGATLQSPDAQPMLTPDGHGAQFINDFEGTGFHVGGGYVLTNRHLALEPWKADERVQSLSASVRGQFRLMRLVAFFPGRRQTFVLRFKQAAQNDDLAICLIDIKEIPADLPVLPLDKNAEGLSVGKKIVMIGFPRGLDYLLAANLSESESRGLQTRFGNSTENILAALADRNLVKPRTTEGNITDIEDHRIAYDISSAEGASGAPLFGPSGRVIGVNSSSYIYMANANFGIPVRYALAPLQRAGWKPPEPPAPAEPVANSNANAAKDTRLPTNSSAKPSTIPGKPSGVK